MDSSNSNPQPEPKREEFFHEYIKTLTSPDLEYYENLIDKLGFDPYELHYKKLSIDHTVWPKVSDWDRINYLVLRTSYTTGERMRNVKGLEAHNFLTSKKVSQPHVKVLPDGSVLLLVKVGHSQRNSEQPLRCWLVVQKDGCIDCAWCSCVAGIGTTCSHVAAVVFLLEYEAKAKDGLVCTDLPNKWLPPSLSAVPLREVKDMDFRSAEKRKRDLDSHLAGADVCPTPRPRRHSVGGPTPERIDAFLKDLNDVIPHAVVFSAYEQFCDPYRTPVTTPLDLTKLYDRKNEDLEWGQLVKKCQALFEKMTITAAELKWVERRTRKQRDSALWFMYRFGRITSSNVPLVLSGDVNKPAKSTIRKLCTEGRVNKNISNLPEDLQRGIELEEPAKKQYIVSSEHRGVRLKESGLYIHPQEAWLAASPDGVVTCECCEGFGVLEVKCPRPENLGACFNADGELAKNNSWYRQMQCHMLVTGAKYCDLFCYTPTKQIVHRVRPDPDVWSDILTVGRAYFKQVVLPEIVASWHTRHSVLAQSNTQPQAVPSAQPQASPLAQPQDNPTICWCSRPKFGDVVTCAGSSPFCLREFHAFCLGRKTTAKDKLYFCTECKDEEAASKPKPKRKRRKKDDENAQP